jgi:hypothetical protein
MSDNVTVTAGTGTTIHADEYTHSTLGSGKTQLVKLVDGTLDQSTAVAAGGGVEANALRVTIASDSTGVVSIDDNGGSITVDGTFYQATQPVSGTVAVTNAGITSIDGKITACNTGAVVISSGAVTADLGANNDVTVTNATAANCKVEATIVNGSINGSGSPTIDSYGQAAIGAKTGADQAIISAPGANKQIWVYGGAFTISAAGTIAFQDEDNTVLSGVMPIDTKGGLVLPLSGNFAMPYFKVATNKALEMDIVTGTVDGWLNYAIVSV